MNVRITATGIARGRIIVLAVVMAASFSALLPSGLLAVESSPRPGSVASPGPSLTPAEAACASADDLRLIVGFLQDTDPSEDGWLPLLVGAIAGLSEAQQLAALVGETYQPLVDDLIASLEGLQTTVEQLGDEGTIGAKLAEIGEAITDIGNAMDALSTQLQEPCPVGD
jgi:hypothetical protein